MKKIILKLIPLLLLTSCTSLPASKLNPLQQSNEKFVPVPVEKTDLDVTISTPGLVKNNKVIAKVSEQKIEQIHLAQNAVILTKNNPEKPLAGKVIQIADNPTENNNLKSFAVEIDLAGSTDILLPDTEDVTVNFTVGKREDILVIPTIAIDRQEDTTGVLVGAPDRPPRFVPITVGIRNGDRTEVTSGLDGTEHILIEASELPPHMRRKSEGMKDKG